MQESGGHSKNNLNRLLLTDSANHSSITLSHTIYDINNFGLLPWNDTSLDDTYHDENILNVSINEGYFRYRQRLSTPCVAFIFTVKSFNETVRAIQNSGYGSSNDAVFFIETSSLLEDDHVVNGFLNNLFYSEGPSFHATIVFFTSTSREVGVFCYFCFEKDKSIHKQYTQLLYSDLQIVSHKINSNGYGNLAYVYDVMGHATQSRAENCLLYYNPKRERTGVFGEHVNCSAPWAWEMSFVTRRLNMSATCNIDKIDENSNRWFLQARFGEGLMLTLPNEYIQTRGIIQFVDQVRLEAVSCRELATSRVINLSITSAFDKWSWGCLVIMIVLYGLTFRSITKGFDILWTFFGKPLMCSRRQCSLFILVFMVSLLSYIYQSVISSDSMQLAEYPGFFKLIKEGYKISVPDKRPVVSVINSLKNSTIESMTKQFGAHPLTVLNAGEYKFETLDFFRNMSRLKHVVTYQTHPHVITTIGKDVVAYMGDDLVCKVFSLSDYFEFPYRYTFRFWSYLSHPFSKALGHLFSAGIYNRLNNIMNARAGINIKKLRIVKSTTFSKPIPIALKSTIGICLCICAAVNGCALIWWILCWSREKKSEISGSFRHLKQKLYLKFTTSVTKVEDFKNLN
ncbi:unnamed protein product [Orchesella dallaii]|uniref:Uncharacterized protein n=1 Tax=Orchesella dallaii TaxID=48710 RepID=A0ABP1RPZ0_9HEXA